MIDCMTVYRVIVDHKNSDLLVVPHRRTSVGDWSTQVICAQHNSVLRPGDNTYVPEDKLMKATEQDFADFRLAYPQGYNN